MAQGRRSRFPAPQRRGGRQFSRSLIVSVALACVFALAYVLGTGALSTRQPTETPTAKQRSDPNTGAIVFMPVLGNDCRQNVIDNATGQIREAGPVPCDEALARSRRDSGQPSTRFDVIRESFRKQRP